MGYFKRSLMVGAMVSGLLLQGCQGAMPEKPSYSSGSLALSTDDKLVYAADTDNGLLVVIDAVKNEKIAEVRVGSSPVRVLVTKDDTIFVANRGSRSVSVIRRGEWSEANRLETGIEPSGLALSNDSKTLYVTSATAKNTTEYGTLTAFDTATLTQKWEIRVGEEPRAVAIVGDGTRALVSLFKSGEVVEVDLVNGKVLNDKSGIYEKANASKSSALTTTPSGSESSYHPRASADLIATPDGKRVFMPTVWAREQPITIPPSRVTGYYQNGGPCSVGAVATPGLVTLDTESGVTPRVDDLAGCSGSGINTNDSADFPVSTLAGTRVSFGSTAGTPVQGPTVGVVDPTGQWLFVVNRESKNVAVLPTGRRSGNDLDFNNTGTSVRQVIGGIGNGADGIALSRDGKQAYVYSQFDHKLSVLDANGVGDSAQLKVKSSVVVAQETLAADVADGRRLFFDAIDTRMSGSLTTVACSTCHLEGREDGHVWQFPDGPRQTPSMAGRQLLATAPYHWSGEFETIKQFSTHTITERMGGTGLAQVDSDKLNQFMDRMAVPERPMNMTMPTVQAGRVAFEKAGCDTCHTGALLTNNGNAKVGSEVARDEARVRTGGFNVPSLLGVSRTAPYLHDGSAKTLSDRIFNNTGDKHGVTSTLSAQEKSDLVDYLKSL